MATGDSIQSRIEHEAMRTMFKTTYKILVTVALVLCISCASPVAHSLDFINHNRAKLTELAITRDILISCNAKQLKNYPIETPVQVIAPVPDSP